MNARYLRAALMGIAVLPCASAARAANMGSAFTYVVVWLPINIPGWAQEGGVSIMRPDEGPAETLAILPESDGGAGDKLDVVMGNCSFCNPITGDCCAGFCVCEPGCATTICNPACGGNNCNPGCPGACDDFLCPQNRCTPLCGAQCDPFCGGDICNPGCGNECSAFCPGNPLCKPACGGNVCNPGCPLECSELCPLNLCHLRCPPAWVSGFGPANQGGQGINGQVYALVVFDDDANGPHPPALYAGGDFFGAGGGTVNNIAKWDGSSWSALGGGMNIGMNNVVRSLTVFDDDGPGGPNRPALYAGGQFTLAGGVTANKIAKWNPGTPGTPATWSGLSTGLDDGIVNALTAFNGALYAGGSFSKIGMMTFNNIAKWNGASWSKLGSYPGTNATVWALTVFDNALYAGGAFSTTGGTTNSYKIAGWDGTSWFRVGSGMETRVGAAVYALTGFDDGTDQALYAGGEFTTADGFFVDNIAKWNGSAWSELGSGMDDLVRALTVFDDGTGPALYAGGDFTKAGGVNGTSHIAKWNGSVWSPLGTGIYNSSGSDAPVHALAVFDDGTGQALYAGGLFSGAGGVPSENIAKWTPCRLPVSRKLLVNGPTHVSGLNDGTSWENAFTTLQDALAVAEPSDEIWVAKGTYRPDVRDGSRAATFQLKSGVEIYGGFAGDESNRNQRDPIQNETILSGDLNGNDTKVPCTAHSPDCDSFGRLCDDGFCILSYKNFENSHHVVTGSGTDATAILAGFTIRDGNAIELEVAGIPYGGGMLIQTGGPTVFDCTFSGNLGAGMYIEGGSPTVSNCTFRGNSATSGGGIGGGGSPTVTNCAFIRNSANDGGGMASFSGSATVNNCTFSGNSASNTGGGMYNYASSPTVINCVLWGDSPNEIVNDLSSPTIRFCDVQGGLSFGAVDGGGNIDLNPMFVHSPDPGADGNQTGVADDYVDLRLQPGSPCINAGDSKLAAHPGETDLDGHSRVLCGLVDMGAYEFGIGDYDCDRVVNLADFTNWASCMTGPSTADTTASYDLGCEAFDFDGDRDADLVDFSGFQKIISP